MKKIRERRLSINDRALSLRAPMRELLAAGGQRPTALAGNLYKGAVNLLGGGPGVNSKCLVQSEKKVLRIWRSRGDQGGLQRPRVKLHECGVLRLAGIAARDSGASVDGISTERAQEMQKNSRQSLVVRRQEHRRFTADG